MTSLQVTLVYASGTGGYCVPVIPEYIPYISILEILPYDSIQ